MFFGCSKSKYVRFSFDHNFIPLPGFSWYLKLEHSGTLFQPIYPPRFDIWAMFFLARELILRKVNHGISWNSWGVPGAILSTDATWELTVL